MSSIFLSLYLESLVQMNVADSRKHRSPWSLLLKVCGCKRGSNSLLAHGQNILSLVKSQRGGLWGCTRSQRELPPQTEASHTS